MSIMTRTLAWACGYQTARIGRPLPVSDDDWPDSTTRLAYAEGYLRGSQVCPSPNCDCTRIADISVCRMAAWSECLIIIGGQTGRPPPSL